MITECPNPRASLQQCKGSALLLTLLVVSLLITLVLTFTLQVRMELRNVGLKQDSFQAQSNARLGAELAIARLQETLGPDTRVSAAADLFRVDSNNVYQPGLSSQVATRRWTGAWDSQSYNENDSGEKSFKGWLVSAPNQDALKDVGVVSSDPSGSGSLRLVGPGTVSRPEDEVYVREVPIDGNPDSLYGYWVGDEGTKARFNLQDPFRGTPNFTQRQYSMRAAQRHAAELFTFDQAGNQPLSQSGWYPLDNEDFALLRERMAGPSQLPLLGWSPESRNAFQSMLGLRFHDFSLTSRGLMTDTAHGGLRTDLSLAFEMPIEDFLAHPIFGATSPDSEIPAYRPPGFPASERITPVFRIDDFSPFGFQPENSPNDAATNPSKTIAPVLRGPSWQIVRNYHRSYKESDPDRARYGLDPVSYRNIGGRLVAQGRSLYPNPASLGWMRRYGQDASVWTNAELFGPPQSNYTLSRPIEQPVHPGVSPLVTHVQIVFSVRAEPEILLGVPTGNYVADVYMEPLVTIWNPYNVPLATGENNGQPLQLSFRFIDLFMVMQVKNGTTEYRRLKNLFEDTTGNTGAYDGNAHEAFQLTLDAPGGLVMEPGEVVIFSGVDQEVRYQRTAGSLGYTDFSGVNLDLRPDITANLNVNSGIRFANPWNISLLPDAEVRFRTMNIYDPGVPGRDTNWTSKIQVAGVNRTSMVQEPFFGSFDASNVDMATPFSGYYPVQDSNILEVKRPFFIYDAFLKAENSVNPVNLMSQFNLRAPSLEQGNTLNMKSNWFAPAMRVGDLWGGQPAQVNGWNGLFSQFVSNVGRRSYWGGAPNASGGSQFVTLFELPRLPPMSLSSLQHAQVVFMVDEPSLAIGNSLAPIMVRPDEKLSLQQLNTLASGNVNTSFPNLLLRWKENRTPIRNDWTMTRPDWSYLLNESLWDSFFFSSLTPDPATGDSTTQRFNAFMNGDPLPNSTMQPYLRADETADGLRNRIFDNQDIRPDAPESFAGNLMQEGTFNINSTSIEAWRAILSSSRNLIINVQNQSQPRELTGTAFTRTALPFDSENDRWHGFRNFTDAQIDALAKEIVREVRVRGPFLNLSDFINRRLHPSGHDSQRSGPLQSAIDTLSLNQSFAHSLQDGGLQKSNLNDWVKDRVDLNSMVARGAPGYFQQADLLTLIGPLLSARSDTFTVRAYGEFGGSRAWCELVVQRVPGFVDTQDNPSTPPSGLSLVNQSFGRRFVITSFRWLNQEDV